MDFPLLFKPLYMERVWGGRSLEQHLGRTLPEGKVIGESWELVDRPEAQSVVLGGPLEGKTIREVIATQAEQLMGPGYPADRPFPILIKWLDCQQALSLQVHPPARVADELKGEPKTENWYMAACEDHAKLMVGLKDGVTREQFEDGLKNNALEPLVHDSTVKAGDSIFVESGRIHAIGAGNFILEIQQNSDTTYRVYDWGRVGLDGKPRQLHVEESLKSIDFEDFEPEPLRDTQDGDELADCKEFRIRKLLLSDSKRLSKAADSDPWLVSVVDGEVSIHGSAYKKGDNLLLPYSGAFELSSATSAELLLTDHFTG